MKKNVFSIILAMLMIVSSLVFPNHAQATNSRTMDEVRAWLDNEAAMQNQYGDGQCTWFCNHYLVDFWGESGIYGVGSASNWVGHCPANWQNYDVGGNPDNFRMGDLIVERYSPNGHVMVYYGKGDDGRHYVLDQNFNGHLYTTKHIWYSPLSQETYCYRPPINGGSSSLQVEPGVYTIHSAWDWNKVLDIQGDDSSSGANIQLYDFLNNDIQKFRVVKDGDYYCIQSVYSGMWLDVASPVSQSGSNVQLWYTNANNEEKWQFQDAGNGYVYIRNYYGNYLDIQHDSTENGANIQVYGSITNDSQRWRLIPEPEPVEIAEGIYTIHSARDWNMVLDIQHDSTDNRANIQLYENLNNTVQKFRVIRSGNYYCIQSVYSGLWLDVATPITESHSNVQLWFTNANNEEKWQFEDAGNGYLYIRNYYGNYVDIQGDAAVNNANIQVYHATINDSERWRLIPEPEPIDIAEGIYSIHSARDLNKVLDIQGDDPSSGANIQLYDFLDYDVQYFRIVKNGSKYCIQSVFSGMWLDVATPFTESRSNVQLWFTNTNNEEKWIFEDAGNGYVYIRNYYGNYVDLVRDSTANNTNIQVYHAKESDSQRWLLVPVVDTFTVIFKDWDGTVLSSQQVEKGSSAVAPPDPVREGYTFIGWDIDFSNVTSDLTVTAIYEKNSEPIDFPGDVDCDGTVTMADVTILAMYLNGESPEIAAQGMLNADANGDGTVDIRDISAIYELIANS